MLRDIVEKPIPMKSYFSQEAKSLLKGLLEKDPEMRLGSVRVTEDGEDGEDLRKHEFFIGIDWKMVKQRRHKAQFRP
jgi:serum/glucocorticoid-regulated kinase 2